MFHKQYERCGERERKWALDIKRTLTFSCTMKKKRRKRHETNIQRGKGRERGRERIAKIIPCVKKNILSVKKANLHSQSLKKGKRRDSERERWQEDGNVMVNS